MQFISRYVLYFLFSFLYLFALLIRARYCFANFVTRALRIACTAVSTWMTGKTVKGKDRKARRGKENEE